jgi:hypothetical protein
MFPEYKFFKRNTILLDISVSRFGSIHDVTSEPFLSSWAILSLSVGCLSIPTDCWSVMFEIVGYRTTCEHKILFCYTNSFRDNTILGNAYGKEIMKKTQVCSWHKRFRDGRTSVH